MMEHRIRENALLDFSRYIGTNCVNYRVFVRDNGEVAAYPERHSEYHLVFEGDGTIAVVLRNGDMIKYDHGYKNHFKTADEWLEYIINDALTWSRRGA